MNCTGIERQNVSLASQLYSHTAATALLRYDTSEEAENLSKFIEVINRWFDLMNSRNLLAPLRTRNPYKNVDYQIQILDDMFHSNDDHYMLCREPFDGSFSKSNFDVHQLHKKFNG